MASEPTREEVICKLQAVADIPSAGFYSRNQLLRSIDMIRRDGQRIAELEKVVGLTQDYINAKVNGSPVTGELWRDLVVEIEALNIGDDATESE